MTGRLFHGKTLSFINYAILPLSLYACEYYFYLMKG